MIEVSLQGKVIKVGYSIAPATDKAMATEGRKKDQGSVILLGLMGFSWGAI